jgi:hypothetical protein
MAEHHSVVVYEHRGTEKYDPYIIDEGNFVANCECGWWGKQRETADEAFVDAHEHSTNVEPEVLDLWRSDRPWGVS